ncbi:hypothetical protein [Deinococcus planocerae]|uniref:hypothetical protein n=1 Tax=Deinococcus planocerae TaxID=1737569 RepID=UPI000C7ED37E|nr:hypothetical protein [Deinococcus planocerae]
MKTIRHRVPNPSPASPRPGKLDLDRELKVLRSRLEGVLRVNAELERRLARLEDLDRLRGALSPRRDLGIDL